MLTTPPPSTTHIITSLPSMTSMLARLAPAEPAAHPLRLSPGLQIHRQQNSPFAQCSAHISLAEPSVVPQPNPLRLPTPLIPPSYQAMSPAPSGIISNLDVMMSEMPMLMLNIWTRFNGMGLGDCIMWAALHSATLPLDSPCLVSKRMLHHASTHVCAFRETDLDATRAFLLQVAEQVGRSYSVESRAVKAQLDGAR